MWPSYWLQGSIHRVGHDRDRHCGLDPPVHRDENDEELRSSALQARTLAQRDRRLVNPQGRWRVAVILASRQYPPRRPLKNLPSFPRRRESIGKSNLAD